MKGGTLFSGIGAPEFAASGIDWRWSAENDKFASSVHAARFPSIPNLGDVTKVSWDEQEPVDVVVFGSPCQSFSVAGRRAGLDDPRGNLTLVGLGIIERLRPRWFVWENVPGVLSLDGGRVFGAILGIMGELRYGFAYRVLDAQFFGVPQRRRRVFVVGCLGGWRRAAAVLFEPESLRGDSPPSREAGERTAQPLASSPQGGSGYRNDADTADNLIAFGGNDTRGAIDVATALNAHGGSHGRIDFESETFVVDHMMVRRLLPVEAERLQGFSDGWTAITYRGKPAADGPRYRALGNAMAVPVMRWILDRLMFVDSVPPKPKRRA